MKIFPENYCNAEETMAKKNWDVVGSGPYAPRFRLCQNYFKPQLSYGKQ